MALGHARKTDAPAPAYGKQNRRSRPSAAGRRNGSHWPARGGVAVHDRGTREEEDLLRGGRGRVLPLHALPERARSHVGPMLGDVLEALRLRTDVSGVSPAERVAAIGRPDRVLILVVDDHLVFGDLVGF